MFPTINSFASFAFNKVFNSIKSFKISEAFDWVNWAAIELKLNEGHYSKVVREYFSNKDFLK